MSPAPLKVFQGGAFPHFNGNLCHQLFLNGHQRYIQNMADSNSLGHCITITSQKPGHGPLSETVCRSGPELIIMDIFGPTREGEGFPGAQNRPKPGAKEGSPAEPSCDVQGRPATTEPSCDVQGRAYTRIPLFPQTSKKQKNVIFVYL